MEWASTQEDSLMDTDNPVTFLYVKPDLNRNILSGQFRVQEESSDYQVSINGGEFAKSGYEFSFPLEMRTHTLWVKYMDADGRQRGPYTLSYNPIQEYIKEWTQGLGSKGWFSGTYHSVVTNKAIYFMGHKDLGAFIKSVEYSFNDKGLNESHMYKTEYLAPYGDVWKIGCPDKFTHVYLRFVYIDNTKSPIVKIPFIYDLNQSKRKFEDPEVLGMPILGI
jgi:hypothetical protein